MAELVAPHARYRTSFLACVEEFLAEGRGGDNTMLGDWRARFGECWHTPEGFAEFVDHLHLDARPESPRPDRHVPQSTWWFVEGDDYLGRISCRHLLTEWLLEYGGHVGYEVRPTARRRGHATAMLRAVLPCVHALGIDPALLTCDDTNVASRKVIEAAGGVLEDQRGAKLRYWVPTR